MTAGDFQIMSIAGFLFSIGFSIAAVIVFFRLKVWRLIGILTGKTERIGIDRIKNENKEQALKKRSETTDKLVTGNEATTPISAFSDGTVLLGQGRMEEGTTLLGQGGSTTLIGGNDTVGTTLLGNTGSDGTTLLNSNKNNSILTDDSNINNAFVITKEEYFVSTDTVIEI